MKTTLTTLAGLLIGPFIGFFVTHFLFYIRSLSHPDCMWRLGALGMGVTVGAPIGLITFGVIGFWVGRLLDKQTKQRLLHQESFGLSKQRIRRVE